jgi:transposase
MRKLRELLRLHFDLKLSQHQIARSINIGQSTVSDYLARFTRAGLSLALASGTDRDGVAVGFVSRRRKVPASPR